MKKAEIMNESIDIFTRCICAHNYLKLNIFWQVLYIKCSFQFLKMSTKLGSLHNFQYSHLNLTTTLAYISSFTHFYTYTI